MERGKFRDGDDFTKRESLEENCGTSVEETRPNSRGALSTEIPGRLAPLENRLAAVRVGHPRGRSAIKPSRSDREIFARDRGHSRTFGVFQFPSARDPNHRLRTVKKGIISDWKVINAFRREER